jgi:hypothetical protein
VQRWDLFVTGKTPKYLDGSLPDRPSNCDKLDDSDPSFASFIFGDEGPRPAKLFGEALLPNTGLTSHCNKNGTDPGTFLWI